jgi:peptidyl-dipeptidase Dcp
MLNKLSFINIYNLFTNRKVKKNPLLESFNTPFDTTPFHKIDPRHFEPAFRIKLKNAVNKFEAIIKNRDKPTIQNTLIPFEKINDEITRLGLMLYNLNSANTNKHLQKVAQKISPKVTRITGKFILNKKFFNRIEYLYQNPDKQTYSNEESYLIETTYRTMKRSGAALKRFKQRILLKTQMRLAKLILQFNENVLTETNRFELTIRNENELLGLPQSLIDEAKGKAKKRNKEGWVFTLQQPCFIPFMKFCTTRTHRETMYKAYTSRCNKGNKFDNNKNIRKIVNLRLRLAFLLRYKSYAHYVLEERMANTPEKVSSFLNILHNTSKKFAISEVDELKIFARKLGQSEDFMPWDYSFYSEKLKNKKFGFDEEEVKPYFKLESVLTGVFGLASKLYGINFNEVSTIAVYHPDVKCYEVYDHDGKFLSILYTDYYARENKQGGAWMTEYQTQSCMDSQMIRPHISICTNFAKPTENNPTLLTFNEVNTLLHEFGHALHGMVANTVFPSLSGTNVFRDFVELPSQIMENWLFEEEWLNTFAFHYQTGERIPGQLVKKIIDARNFHSGYLSERQLSYAMVDMAWHSIDEVFEGKPVTFERAILKETQHFPFIENSSVSTSFAHIFGGGYASGYYGYKWAEVLDADAFELFKIHGIFNTDVAASFRNNILEPGGTMHPMKLYRNFRGNEPSIESLLRRSGLIENSAIGLGENKIPFN